jgi:hypothetical protein
VEHSSDNDSPAITTRRRSPASESPSAALRSTAATTFDGKAFANWQPPAVATKAITASGKTASTSQTDLRGAGVNSAGDDVVAIRKATSLFSNMNLCLPPTTLRGASVAAATADASESLTTQLLLLTTNGNGKEICFKLQLNQMTQIFPVLQTCEKERY